MPKHIQLMKFVQHLIHKQGCTEYKEWTQQVDSVTEQYKYPADEVCSAPNTQTRMH